MSTHDHPAPGSKPPSPSPGEPANGLAGVVFETHQASPQAMPALATAIVTLDFDHDAPNPTPTPGPVSGTNTASPSPSQPANGEGTGDPPGSRKPPVASPKATRGRSKLLSSASASESDLGLFVNLHRDLRRWAYAADAEERAGRDTDFGPLRRICALHREFYAEHRVGILHPAVAAVANAFLRRRDLPGLRRAMAEIVRRELTDAGLREVGHNTQRCFKNALLN